MSNAIGSSISKPDHIQADSMQKQLSGGPASAALRRGGPPDSAGLTCSSPRPVIRGESHSPTSVDKTGQIFEGKGKSARNGDSFDQDTDTDVLRRGTRRKRSVRVNLSVPQGMDDVLLELAERTGSSKASFVMQALHVYLPELRRQLAEHNQPQSYPQRRLVTPAVVAAQDSRDSRSLSRQERRKLERDQQKASRGGDRG